MRDSTTVNASKPGTFFIFKTFEYLFLLGLFYLRLPVPRQLLEILVQLYVITLCPDQQLPTLNSMSPNRLQGSMSFIKKNTG